jgi:signal transduction histidine kinase
LLPIVAASLLLVGIVLARRPVRWGLAGMALALAGWAGSVLLTLAPETRPLGERLLMVGFYVPAGLIVAAREARRAAAPDDAPPLGRAGEATALLLATLFFGVGMARPGLFLLDGGTRPGPAFAPMFLSAAVLSTWPLAELVVGLRTAREDGREHLRYLLLAGFLCCFGGGLNVLLLLLDRPSPLGLTAALCGVALLAWTVRSTRLPAFGRFVEGSLRYSLSAAVLSALYLFAVLVFLRPPELAVDSILDAVGEGLLLFVLVLVGQPFLAGARMLLIRRWFPQQGDVAGLARALVESEARADHAERLAEIGTLAGAVAHEVRNPLGVIKAATRVLEREGANPAAIGEIREQVSRAAGFADELLEYGRPAPLNRRPVELAAAAALAASEVHRALALTPSPTVRVEGDAPPVAADLSQVIRALGILIENASLAVHEHDGASRVRVCVLRTGKGVRVRVEDDGPGVAEAVRDRLFAPFVSARGRGGPRPGTGLGLAIARGVAERHGGTLRLDPAASPMGGACFILDLPTSAPAPLAEG